MNAAKRFYAPAPYPTDAIARRRRRVAGDELHPDVYPACDEDAGLRRIVLPVRQPFSGIRPRRPAVPA